MSLKTLVAAASFATLGALPSAALAQHDHSGMGHQMGGEHGSPDAAKAGRTVRLPEIRRRKNKNYGEGVRWLIRKGGCHATR